VAAPQNKQRMSREVAATAPQNKQRLSREVAAAASQNNKQFDFPRFAEERNKGGNYE